MFHGCCALLVLQYVLLFIFCWGTGQIFSPLGENVFHVNLSIPSATKNVDSRATLATVGPGLSLANSPTNRCRCVPPPPPPRTLIRLNMCIVSGFSLATALFALHRGKKRTADRVLCVLPSPVNKFVDIYVSAPLSRYRRAHKL